MTTTPTETLFTIRQKILDYVINYELIGDPTRQFGLISPGTLTDTRLAGLRELLDDLNEHFLDRLREELENRPQTNLEEIPKSDV